MPERKALCETMLAELSIDDTPTVTPAIRIPLSWADTPYAAPKEKREPPTARRFAPVDPKWAARGSNPEPAD
jgi:hypothetical protein